MSMSSSKGWRDDFGVNGWKPPKFFGSAEEVDSESPPPPQAHSLRRAFQRLKLDGIVCLQNSPAIYFKEVSKAELPTIEAIHRHFWYQGIAPILVLIDPDNVHVYSGLSLPKINNGESHESYRLVEKLGRIAQAAELRRLVLAVESGEYFRQHVRSFDPKKRVDRELLRNLGATREALLNASLPNPNRKVLDALLCRVVFSCYLFDRGVIGKDYLSEIRIADAAHLRDILSTANAKNRLYSLFKQLGKDFNGDLFIDDLDNESAYVTDEHLTILNHFLCGTDAATGQQSFWPYEFDIIPIETISAIYERFLKSENAVEKRKSGAFYTPRFLAEATLGIALDGIGSLLNKKFLDPACGSGIFLVGLFNRIAEEWTRTHPNATYERRANALIDVLRNNLFGVDLNQTACRIAAFSLYLAFLDQLSPPDIKILQRKGKMLPRLVWPEGQQEIRKDDGHTIRRGDFFAPETGLPDNFDVVIGNPPWAKLAGPLSSAEHWCHLQKVPIGNRQLAAGFVWKATKHQSNGGRICFILPAMLMFNHQDTAVEFQRAWLERHSVDVALNLADMRFNLFAEAAGPALVVRYRKEPPAADHRVKYLAPKTSWSISQAEIVTILPEDRTEFRLAEAIADTKAKKPPLAFKERFWGTPRDWKLLDRLLSLPPLNDIVGQTKERHKKRWVMAEGFKPELAEGKTEKPVPRPWPDTHLFLDARSKQVELFVLESDCAEIGNRFSSLHRTITADEIFARPHILVWYGLRVAFADIDVLFRHAIRGIHGPKADSALLMFATAYLRSPLARYFLFHTSANWGVERQQIHLEEVLRAPFPLPEKTVSPKRCREIVDNVASRIKQAMKAMSRQPNNRKEVVKSLQAELNLLVYEYFDIDDNERALVNDTEAIFIKSILPKRASPNLPTLKESTPQIRQTYSELLCETLNDWASGGRYQIHGTVHVSPKAGVGAVVLQRVSANKKTVSTYKEDESLIPVLDHLQQAFKKEMAAVEFLRGIKVIDGNSLYLLKPLSQRFWTKTAALNDADEVAATILMRSRKEAR